MSPINKNEIPNNETINSITADTKTKSSENGWLIIGGKKKWIRICPSCQSDIVVSSEKYYREATKGNRLCLSCSSKKSHKIRGHISNKDKRQLKIKCLQCSKLRPYYRTIGNNRVCKSCVGKNTYDIKRDKIKFGILNNRKNSGKSDKPKPYTRSCPKCGNPIKHTSLHYTNKNKHRRCKSCACKENISKNGINFPFIPSFNPISCNIIDDYGKSNGYNFQHALNGGEVCVPQLGVWLDGYDKDKNVVIECYEPFHYYCDGRLKQKDLTRETNILNHLKCEFIRIKYNGKTNNIESINIL